MSIPSIKTQNVQQAQVSAPKTPTKHSHIDELDKHPHFETIAKAKAAYNRVAISWLQHY